MTDDAWPVVAATVDAASQQHAQRRRRQQQQPPLQIAPLPKRNPRMLVLRREILADAPGAADDASTGSKLRSFSYINGIRHPPRALQAIGALLLDHNGQASGARMRSAAGQLSLLDGCGGGGIARVRREFALQARRAAQRAADARRLAALTQGGRVDALRALAAACEAADVAPGEPVALRQEAASLSAARRAAEHAAAAAGHLALLAGRGDAARAARRELRSLENALRERDSRREQSDDSPELALALTAGARLEEAAALAADASERAVEVARSLAAAEQRAAEVGARRAELRRIEADALVGGAMAAGDDLREAADRAAMALAEADDAPRRAAEAREDAIAAASAASAAAARLGELRRRAARSLEGAMRAELARLQMPSSRFEARVAWREADGDDSSADVLADAQGNAVARVREDGGLDLLLPVPGDDATGASKAWFASDAASPGAALDGVAFLLAAAAGEPLRPLAEVASGGEAARAMLALKVSAAVRRGEAAGAEARSAAAPTASAPAVAAFDEIDSGVGGRLGARVGESLLRLARSGQQVVAVTHLAQVAVLGDAHARVFKEVVGEGDAARAVTRLERLETRAARLEELSQMLGLGRGAAEALLESQEAAAAAGAGGGEADEAAIRARAYQIWMRDGVDDLYRGELVQGG